MVNDFNIVCLKSRRIFRGFYDVTSSLTAGSDILSVHFVSGLISGERNVYLIIRLNQ